MKRDSPLKIYFDGGCRPNPGAMEIAVVVRGILYHKANVGNGTNNDAEWLALLYACEMAVSLCVHDVIFIGDAALVVNQANGTAKCRSPDMRRYLDIFTRFREGFDRVRIRHTGRSQNLAGIALAKLAQQRLEMIE
jgi:ribonuclease HI